MSCECKLSTGKAKSCNNNDGSILDSVKNYYGKVLQKNTDLKTNACCTSDCIEMTATIKEALSSVHQAVQDRYYGCGIVIPEYLKNLSVLDMGSGSGRDCFALSKLVGPKGSVIGVDMTEEQLEISRKYLDHHSDLYGYQNVQFRHGFIEDLANSAAIETNSFDLIVSNCVINLSPNKQAVLKEAHRVLKTGGELYFGDIYSDRVLPLEARNSPELWGECLAGALFWRDLLKICELIGFSSPRLYNVSAINFDDKDYKDVLGSAQFASITYRMFKLPTEVLDDRLINTVTYCGGIPDHEDFFKLDQHMQFKKGEVKTITSELTRILKISRFGDCFKFQTTEKGCCGGVVENSMHPFHILSGKDPSSVTSSCCTMDPKSC